MRPTHPRTRPGLFPALAVACLLSMTAGLSTRAEAEDDAPGAKAAGKAAPLARYVPRDGLAAFLEFDGLDSHADRWRHSAAYRILNETKTGALVADLLGQGFQGALDAAPPGARKPTGEQLVRLIKAILRDGFVFGITGLPARPPAHPHAVLAVRGGAQGEVREAIDQFSRSKPERKAGRSVYTMPGMGNDAPVYWFEGNDLVMTAAADFGMVASVIDGNTPNAVGHPIRTALAKDDRDFETVARGFLDFSAFPRMTPPAAAAGLDGLERLELRWGFQDDALLTVVDVVAPAPRKGLLALIDQPTFDRNSLPPLPAGLTGFTVESVDLAKAYDKFVRTAKQGGGGGEVPEDVERVRRDLLPHLGPKFALYSLPDATAVSNPMLAMMTSLNGLTISAETDDAAALGKALETLVALANQAFKAPRNPPRPGAASPEVRKTGDAPLSYTLNLPPGSVPPGPLAALRPTMIVGESHVVLGALPRTAEKALALADHARAGALWRPTGAFEPMARRLPTRMILLNVSDPRETLPGLVAGLPALVPLMNAAVAQAQQNQARGGDPRKPFSLRIDPEQVPTAAELTERLFPASLAVSVDARGLRLTTREPVPNMTSPSVASGAVVVALLLPAVQSAREAARRAQCVNNEKQIALAMHIYHDVNNHLPPAVIRDKSGKPLLSWRVAILPYIEQAPLYNRFKLDEPWDSPSNKPLIAAMPQIYTCPSRPATPGTPGLSCYRVFTGKGTAFPPDEAIGFAKVTDGLSNTLMVVETRDGVPWTKPEDLEFDPDAKAPAKPCFGAGSYHTGGFNAAMLDGSVRFLKNSIAPHVFRALITRDAGEVIGAGSY